MIAFILMGQMFKVRAIMLAMVIFRVRRAFHWNPGDKNDGCWKIKSQRTTTNTRPTLFRRQERKEDRILLLWKEGRLSNSYTVR